MKTGNIFYASDKAIYDALTTQKMKNSDIKTIFLSRGIITSSKTQRDELALYFSRLNHSYGDYQMIADTLGSSSQKERSSTTIIDGTIDEDILSSTLNDVKESCDEFDEYGNLVKTKLGYNLVISYTKIDFNKSEIKQTTHKESCIILESSPLGIVIRYPDNERAYSAAQDILQLIQEKTQNNLQTQNFSMPEIENPILRTNFFNHLALNMKGYKRENVLEVSVYHPTEVTDKEYDPHIRRIKLQGQKVTSTGELDNLYKKGFYICKIRWIAIEKTETGPRKIEIEAQFSNPETFEGFSYIVKGEYKISQTQGKTGSYQHVEKRTNVDTSLDLTMSRIIETAAKHAIDKIKKESFNALKEDETEEEKNIKEVCDD